MFCAQYLIIFSSHTPLSVENCTSRSMYTGCATKYKPQKETSQAQTSKWLVRKQNTLKHITIRGTPGNETEQIYNRISCLSIPQLEEQSSDIRFHNCLQHFTKTLTVVPENLKKTKPSGMQSVHGYHKGIPNEARSQNSHVLGFKYFGILSVMFLSFALKGP